MLSRDRYETISYVGVITAIILGLYLSSLFSYPLFHSLIEIATIAIGFTLFILAWNARRFLTNDCLTFVGIGYAFIAVIDLLHTLAYKGMSIFPGYGANLPTQLWIAARFLQAATLCTAPVFARRRAGGHLLFGAYLAAVSMIAALVFSGNFPDCYVEGKGLTLFKIISEYAISAMLIISLILFHKVRKNFNHNVYALIIASIACTALSEISFTAYLSVYGFANMFGHLLKLAAFYLIYRALLVTGLKEPFDLIFRDLKQTEEALRKAHDTLEEKVGERTAELLASEEKYRGLIHKIQVAVVVHGADTRILVSNLAAQQLLGLTEEQLTGKSGYDPDWRFFREDGTAMLPEEYPVNRALTTKQPIRNAVAGVHRPGMEEDVWVLVSADPVPDEQGETTQVIVTFIDITARKRAEESLRRLNRELRAVSNCNQVLMRAVDEQALLNDVCRIICDEAGYRMAWVGYAENDDAKSVRPVAWAGVEDGYLATVDITWADTERGRGPTGTAVRSGESAWIRDFTTDSKAAPWRDGAWRRGYRSSIAIPLKDESGNSFGALTIYSTEPDTFNTPDEVRLLEELTDDLAFGIIVLRVRNARNEAERNIALLSFALDNVHEAAFLTDESAHFRYVNEESCRALGYARDELLGLGVAEIDPDFPMERWGGHWDELKRRGSLTFESRHKRKEGGIFPVEIYANYFEYYEAEYILALVRDISERKRVEDTLRFIAQRGWAGTADTFLTALAGYLGNSLGMDYVLIAQLADDDYGVAETAALYGKGEILPNMRYKLKGTPCEKVIGKRLCLYPKGVQALFPEDTLLVDMGAESYAGIPLWDSAGRPVGLLAALDGRPFHDENTLSHILQLAATSAAAALERERHDRLLTAREREFRTLAENSPDSILRYDNGCRCIYANPRIENTLGIPAGGMAGKTPMELFPAGEYREYQDRIEEVLRTGADADLEIEVPDTGEGGRYHHVRFTAERDQEGAITGVLVIGRDITERKRAEDERLAHMRLLESMDRVNRAMQGTTNIEQMMSDVLDVVLSIFECDRAFLSYPCDPEADSWTVPMERTKPEYPGILALGLEMPMGPDVAETFRTLLASDGPVKFGPGTLHPLPAEASERFGFKSLLSMALCPKVGKPWQFGLHQCSHARVWSPEEERLFQEIGRRLADSLTSLLTHRDLRESEARYRRIVDTAAEGIWMVGPDFMTTFVNARMCEMLGCSGEEMIGRPFTDFMFEEDTPDYQRKIENRRQGFSESYERRFRRKDGQTVWTQASATPIFNNERHFNGLFAMFTDITERKRTESALELSQFSIDNASMGIVRGNADGKILSANEHWARVLGYSLEELCTMSFFDIDPNLTPESWLEHRKRLVATGFNTFESVQRRKDGTTFPVEVTVNYLKYGDQVFSCSFIRDITERKRAEAEVERLKNYLANIIDSMPSILVGMDRNETVIQWNRQAEEFTGISAAEAVGRPITDLLPDFSPWIKGMRSEIDQRCPTSMEKLLFEKEGERRFYDLMLYPLIADGVEGTVVSIEDATERARIQELMIQTEKMLSVGGMAAGMAHEINNPLGIITQAAQNIERRVSPELPANLKAAEELGVSLEGINAYFDKRRIPEFIGSIRKAGSRAAKIVANMLQFSRCAGTTLQPASLAGIIEQSLDLAGSDYDLKKKFDFRSIEIIRDYAPDMPEVPMVTMEMEQVMLNLLKNAAQAMTLNPPDRGPRITLRLRREERYALIEVEDNGPGMPEDVRRRVFEPFFTTKEPGLGTGLGLSVSYMIVTQNHKGLMEVESKPGRGACFRVRLPLSKEGIHG